MRSQRLVWNQQSAWTPTQFEAGQNSLVFYFGTRQALAGGARYHELRALFPAAHILGCSTGGQIDTNDIGDDEIIAAAIDFDATRLRLSRHEIGDASQSRACGEAIGRDLQADDLAGVFVLSDGLNVNGSALVDGLTGVIGPKIPLTGGLAGDGADFKETLVGGDCAPQARMVAAIGFYGPAIRIGHGSAGGWDVFGPRRQVTKSAGNVLFELDGEPALDLYERYLGPEDSQGLPGSALLFPIQVHDAAHPDSAVVRTVLAVDRDARSMTFAGDVPQGWTAQLMRGSFDRLAAGAADAARQSRAGLNGHVGDEKFSILVSCIGRRLLMGQRTTDETEAAGVELGPDMMRLGFYSYGEISPHAKSGQCELHNQTMTVTSFAEVGN
ncbi:MAG TPA: FIST N-terminal domain-containing protein [Bradyrhizobium sp.]|nr:FIST N-terminal domain-containing protein [Bradyrhizobium sp.]